MLGLEFCCASDANVQSGKIIGKLKLPTITSNNMFIQSNKLYEFEDVEIQADNGLLYWHINQMYIMIL